MHVHGLSGRRDTLGYALFNPGAGCIHCWEEIGTLDPIKRLRLFNVERSYSQVPVIFKCEGDQLLHLLINKKLLPFDVSSSLVNRLSFTILGLISRAAGPVGRHRRFRARIFGGHARAAGEGK